MPQDKVQRRPARYTWLIWRVVKEHSQQELLATDLKKLEQLIRVCLPLETSSGKDSVFEIRILRPIRAGHNWSVQTIHD